MQSSPYGRVPSVEFASLARARVKDPTRRAKHAITIFKANPDVNSLNDATALT